MSYDHEHRESAEIPTETFYHHLPTNHNHVSYMESYLDSRHLCLDTAVYNGWYLSKYAGDSHLRIVIPATGHLVRGYWQARAIYPHVEPRYQSPTGPRGDSVILTYPLEDEQKTVLVTEGPMCTLAAAELGFTSIAMMGADPPALALALTKKLVGKRPCLLVADSDRPDMWAKVLSGLSLLGVTCRLIVPAKYKDLASMPILDREDFIFPLNLE